MGGGLAGSPPVIARLVERGCCHTSVRATAASTSSKMSATRDDNMAGDEARIRCAIPTAAFHAKRTVFEAGTRAMGWLADEQLEPVVPGAA
jgi:hypothetical protein